MRLFSRRPLSFPRFTRAQVHGVLWLLPLMAVAAAVLVTANRPRFEKSFLEQVEESNISWSRQRGKSESVAPPGVAATRYDFDEQSRPDRQPDPSTRSARFGMTEFDPNALTVGGFEALGFSRRQAEAIVRYRTVRGGFREPEDLGKSYVVSPEMFERLRPYMQMSESPRSMSFRTESQASGGISSPETGDPSTRDARFGMTAPVAKVDLNAADSATLRTVRGIGEKLVGRIIDYRRRLGGYASKEQLKEIPGMYLENFERIAEQIFVDSAVIQKIDINFAAPDVLGKHPYITSDVLRKLLKHRQLKGGWRTTQELKDENILTADQARRLDPYLNFKTTEK